MKNKISKMISYAESIVILAHDNEDADAIGSCNAFRGALLTMGRNAVCIFSDEPEQRLSFMAEDYRVYDGKSDEYELCICLDCAELSRLGARKEIFDKAKQTICIDHHITNMGFADINIINANAAATGEILYEVFCDIGIAMNQDIAKNLYAAISSDSGSFKYSNVSPKTLEIASQLLKYDIKHDEIARALYDTETPQMLRFKGKLMNSIKSFSDGKICMVYAPRELLEEYSVNDKDTGDIVNIPRTAVGCEIAVSIREYSDKIKVSFRSNGKYDVAEIAAKIGGGGHKMAAGASIFGKSMQDAEELVLKICEEAING